MNDNFPKIKYNIPEFKLDGKFVNNEKLTNFESFFDKLENIENIRNNSLIMTEISNSKLNIDKEDSKIASSNIIFHNGIKCCRCNSLIIGKRYKCIKCLNYNLCEECEQLNSEIFFHPHINQV